MSTKVCDVVNISNDPSTKVPCPALLTTDNLGIEIELEGVGRLEHSQLSYWNIVHDGSLRDAGLEFVFKQPLGGVDVLNALTELELTLTKASITPIISDRTSVHVHLDVRDMTAEQLFSLIISYAFVEKVLMRYCGEERMRNNYCVPLYDVSPTFHTSISQLKNNFKGGVFLFGENDRYSAFNLSAIQKYGSVEFRGHGGAYQKDVILDWVNFILALKKYAISVDYDKILSFHTHISAEGVLNTLREIFTTEQIIKLRSDYLADDLRSTIPVVQDILFNHDIISFTNTRKFLSQKNTTLTKRIMQKHNPAMYEELYGSGSAVKEKPKKPTKPTINPFNITMNEIRNLSVDEIANIMRRNQEIERELMIDDEEEE